MPNREIKNTRNVVGPADPATRRRMMAEDAAGSRAESKAGMYSSKPVTGVADEQGIIGPDGRLNTRKQRIDQVVDRAQKG